MNCISVGLCSNSSQAIQHHNICFIMEACRWILGNLIVVFNRGKKKKSSASQLSFIVFIFLRKSNCCYYFGNDRGNWEVTRQEVQDSQVITMVPSDRDIIGEYDEYSTRTTSSICCRSVAIIVISTPPQNLYILFTFKLWLGYCFLVPWLRVFKGSVRFG